MTPQSIYAFIAARDRMPTDRELKQQQLERYQRMMQKPRDEKHKTYLREGIFNTKKVLGNV